MSSILVEVVRSRLVESVHRGTLVVLDAGGVLVEAVGDPWAVIWPRSCMKPLQAVAMVRAGLDVDDELLALAASSHSGEAVHVAGVRRLLATAGLGPEALDNTAGLPLGPEAAQTLLLAGGGPDRIHQNCSGKHAAMLVTAVLNGWPTDGYRDPDHPLQVALRNSIEDTLNAPVESVGVDGCGAPLFGVPLQPLARGLANVVAADPGTPERRVADAMRAHPDLVGGTGRHVTSLMRAVPGLLAKDGAEGVYVAALPGGPSVVVKVEDGADRAAGLAATAALIRHGVDADALAPLTRQPVLGHGIAVGEMRAVQPS
ncbi:MAG TPA: asparaginase [Mycobacteriales bacterium]|nr:asparaginase [Mycobacteriales bacterium]